MLMKQSPFKCSEQFLKTTGSTFLPLPACDSTLGWRCGRNIPLNGVFLQLQQESWQSKGTAGRPQLPLLPPPLAQAPKPMLSKCTDLTLGYTLVGVGTGGSDIFEDEVLKAGTNFSTATGRDFPCKAMNMIAISHCSHHAGFPSSFCVWPCLTDSPSSDPAQESVSASA